MLIYLFLILTYQLICNLIWKIDFVHRTYITNQMYQPYQVEKTKIFKRTHPTESYQTSLTPKTKRKRKGKETKLTYTLSTM